MKKALIFPMLASAMLMLLCCNNEPGFEKSKTSVPFRCSENIPGDATMLISLESSSGEQLMDFEQVKFLRTDDGYATADLALTSGRYRVTDLVVVDDLGHIVFAVPKSNSPLSGEMGPDFITLGMNVERGSNVPITLYSTANYRPEDFGYQNFSAPNKIALNIAVQLEDGNSKFDAALALVLHNNDTVTQFSLSAKMNVLSFNAVPGESYTLLIFKDGYSSQMKTISLANKGQKTIIAKLKPAFSMVAVTMPSGYFAIELDGWPGALVVDWGDGTSEPIQLGDPNEVEVVRDHLYAAPGKYYVNVTGALDQINTLLFSQFEASMTDRVNIEHLPALYDLRFMYTHVPKSIDASQNHGLAFFILWNTDVEEIKISTVQPPYNIELEGSRYVTTASFDQMINDVYDYSVRTGPRGGFISWLYFPNYPDFSTIAPIGPPSPETIEKMIILQNEYAWDFGPDADYDFSSGLPW